MDILTVIRERATEVPEAWLLSAADSSQVPSFTPDDAIAAGNNLLRQLESHLKLTLDEFRQKEGPGPRAMKHALLRERGYRVEYIDM